MKTTDPTAAGSLTDEREGFPRRKAQLARMSTEALIAEYKVLSKHCLHGLFCQNAQKDQDLIGQALIDRGVDSIPNLFGPIPIKTNWRKLGPAHR